MNWDEKLIATLKARFALLGHSVYDLADGGYVVTRWGHTRQCPDVHALAVFLRQIGGAA
ncbi:hypothetical protein [uncultured Pseudacidovorax sp.]|uniref:hypothetical protein n=1 Tax=uncultured Pseudacidovorax sp. TaxID=679313 RepID=UPI0025D25CAC|nr:hypothetical protein [uncultured Pseudacidovorax sp.]